MKLCKYTVPELDRFRELCNFTEDELSYFELKAKDYTIIKIAYLMNVSESQVSKLARRVNRKIEKIG